MKKSFLQPNPYSRAGNCAKAANKLAARPVAAGRATSFAFIADIQSANYDNALENTK